MRYSSKSSSTASTVLSRRHHHHSFAFLPTKLPLTAILWLTALLALAFIAISATTNAPSSFSSRLFPLPDHDANLAYFMQIVPNTLPHLPRLFCKIYHPRNVYALHFDVKIPQSEVDVAVAQLRAAVPTFDKNTYLVPPDVIVYNGVSMILNTLAGMTFLLDIPNPWHFFINLSGSDYPLTASYLPRQLLAQAIPYNPVFFSLANPSGWRARFKIRSEKLYLDPSLTHAQSDLPSLIETTHDNPLVDNVTFVPVHSEAWMILSRSFVEYLVHSPTARRMLVSLSSMRGSDEFFFASLAFNHPVFNRSLVPHSFRKVIWSYDGVHAGQHPYNIDRTDDQGNFIFKDQLRSCVQWHARKFEQHDSALMDAIDEFVDDSDRVTKIRHEFGKVMNNLRQRYNSMTPATSDRTASAYRPPSYSAQR